MVMWAYWPSSSGKMFFHAKNLCGKIPDPFEFRKVPHSQKHVKIGNFCLAQLNPNK
jgi:hypothetical protein